MKRLMLDPVHSEGEVDPRWNWSFEDSDIGAKTPRSGNGFFVSYVKVEVFEKVLCSADLWNIHHRGRRTGPALTALYSVKSPPFCRRCKSCGVLSSEMLHGEVRVDIKCKEVLHFGSFCARFKKNSFSWGKEEE
jgi:hypothetical protein